MTKSQMMTAIRFATNAALFAYLFRTAASNLGKNGLNTQTALGATLGLVSLFMTTSVTPKDASQWQRILHAVFFGAITGFLFMPVIGRPADTVLPRLYNGVFAGVASALGTVISDTTENALGEEPTTTRPN